MKLLTLLAIPALINTLTQFSGPHQLNKCIMTCEEAVTPCIKDKTCHKDYLKCINHKDPFTCLTSSNNLFISKVAKCMDQKCQKLEQPKIDNQIQDEIQEMQQFTKEPLKLSGDQKIDGEQKKQQSLKTNNDLVQKDQNPKLSISTHEQQGPKVFTGRVIKYNQKGQVINEGIPQDSSHPNGKQKFYTQEDAKADEMKKKLELTKKQNAKGTQNNGIDAKEEEINQKA